MRARGSRLGLGWAAGAWLVAGCSFDATGPGTEGDTSSGGATASTEPEPATAGTTSDASTTDATTTMPPADTTVGPVDGTDTSTSDGADTSQTEGDPNPVEYCTVADLPIPDDDMMGIESEVEVDLLGGGMVVSVELVIQATHSWVGDLRFDLRRDTADVLVINRPSVGAGPGTCGGQDIDVVVHDDATVTADEVCTDAVTPGLSGEILPDNPMNAVFAGMQMVGTWRLRVSDRLGDDTGTLDSWCLRITYR